MKLCNWTNKFEKYIFAGCPKLLNSISSRKNWMTPKLSRLNSVWSAIVWTGGCKFTVLLSSNFSISVTPPGPQTKELWEPDIPGSDGTQGQAAGPAFGDPHSEWPPRVLFSPPLCQCWHPRHGPGVQAQVWESDIKKPRRRCLRQRSWAGERKVGGTHLHRQQVWKLCAVQQSWPGPQVFGSPCLFSLTHSLWLAWVWLSLVAWQHILPGLSLSNGAFHMWCWYAVCLLPRLYISLHWNCSSNILFHPCRLVRSSCR